MKRKKKFSPKESIKLPSNMIHGKWIMAEEKERLRLLKELYTDPIQFLDAYFTEEQKNIITKEVINNCTDPWSKDRCC